MPSEIVMQQAWRFRLWGTGRISTSQGKTVRVLEAGKLNTGPGPDFRDAKIMVDDKIWVGNIEIHRNASDWHRHDHSNDLAYDNVILHVVGNDDCRIARKDGTEILQTTMNVGEGFTGLFNLLLNTPSYVLPMCGKSLHLVPGIFKTDWITALAFERMMRKADDIIALSKTLSDDWLQVVFITLARGLGFGTNTDNMISVYRLRPKALRYRSERKFRS